MRKKFKLESDVDDYVKNKLISLGLEKLKDFNEESAMSDYMKESLKGSAKTKLKSGFGKPDFHIEKYHIPVVIENKLGNKYHVSEIKAGIKLDYNAIKSYAVNGAVYYAQSMIASKKYNEVIAIGISGDEQDNIQISTYYVFSASISPKFLNSYSELDFLQNKITFDEFYTDIVITEKEKHKILIQSRTDILRHSTRLNKLMNNHNVSVEQRVVYVSGMLLAMQDVFDSDGNLVDVGLTPDELKGVQTEQRRDGVVIINRLEQYLSQKDIASDKKRIMLDSFRMSISLDADRDHLAELDKNVSKLFKEKVSINKQIFAYLYEYIYKTIDLSHGALDIMAEMYSTFLKYALSDGASLGKVLTPPYVTTLMTKILDVNKDSKVMDLATGSAAFLVASMTQMIDDANHCYGKKTTKANKKIKKIKKDQLLGVEVDAKMYTLATTNMILRGDGSTKIKKADTFKEPKSLYLDFKANILLLNPPFSYEENGMPFFGFGLDNMEKGGRGAVIIQDSAGSGKAKLTNKKILAKHKMIASIKMPIDLFKPNAGVQTSIYIFESGTPHNFQHDLVKFIDFTNDGYKRTDRGGINEIDNPVERYSDIYYLFKMGKNAIKSSEFHQDLWDIDAVYIEDLISSNGDDWNFGKHYIPTMIPTEENFVKNTEAYLSWEIDLILKGKRSKSDNRKNINIVSIQNKTHELKAFNISELFKIENTLSFNKNSLKIVNIKEEIFDYVTRTSEDRGASQTTSHVNCNNINEPKTYSLGLLQMDFFFRERRWYAGQFVRKITPLFEINHYIASYIETSLNALKPALLSVLVRDVDKTFLNAKIHLPVNNKNEPDWVYIQDYMKEIEKIALAKVKNYLQNDIQ